MKHNFRLIVGMLLCAIPLCVNAQVKPVKVEKDSNEPKQEKQEKPKINPDLVKVSGFVQTFFTADFDENGKLESNEFKMRRARLVAEGKFGQKFSYKLQGNFGKADDTYLVDAFLKYKPCNEFAIQAGQFKLPFSIENPINPVNLEIYDYGEVINKLVGYKDVCGVGRLGRDIGIMATGSLFPIKKEGNTVYNIVDYSIGVFNGNGANAADNNKRKDIVGRLDVHPGLKSLTLSGSFYNGRYSTDAVDRGARNRWAAGAQYNDGNIVVRAEYLSGKTGYNTVADSLNRIISEDFYHSNGYYAEAGYNFHFGKEKSQQLMPVFRYEHFLPNTDVEKGGTTYYTGGLSYWPIKNVNVKLDYQLIENYKLVNTQFEKAHVHRVVAAVNYKF
jgi:hypothetical protein